MNNPTWISRDAEELAWWLIERENASKEPAPEPPPAKKDAELHFDVVIVGSGYGGSIAAYRLAGATKESGKRLRVAVLERGLEYVPGTFPERFADLPGHVRVNGVGKVPGATNRTGLFDLRMGTVSALVGNGLGGGSLINAGVMAEPLPQVFKRNEWPAGIRDICDAEWKRLFNHIRTRLGATEMPNAHELGKFGALCRLSKGFRKNEPCGATAASKASAGPAKSGTKAISVKVAVTFGQPATTFAGVEQQPCIECGNCVTGCNHKAKNTLATTFLPAAWRHGAKIFTGATVERLSRYKAGEEDAWAIHWGFTDTEVAKRFNRLNNGRPPVIRCRYVVLAAGTYGSTEILMRSRDRSAAQKEQDEKDNFSAVTTSCKLGTRYSTNGEMIAIAYGTRFRVNAAPEETQPPRKRGTGPTITGMIDRREGNGKEGYVIQDLAIPAPLRRVFEEIATSTALLHSLTERDASKHVAEAGQDPAAVDAQRIANTPVYGIIGHDDARGCLTWTPPKPAAGSKSGAAPAKSASSAPGTDASSDKPSTSAATSDADQKEISAEAERMAASARPAFESIATLELASVCVKDGAIEVEESTGTKPGGGAAHRPIPAPVHPITDAPSLDGEIVVRWDWDEKSQPPSKDPFFTVPFGDLACAHKRSGQGGTLIPSPLWKLLPEALEKIVTFTETGRLITTHPLGGCPMADDAANGVVNEFGQVFDQSKQGRTVHCGLVVLDGSIVPTSLGINPSLTIAALAWRAVDHLQKEWGLSTRPVTTPEHKSGTAHELDASFEKNLCPLPPARARDSWSADRKPTELRYAEVLTGNLWCKGPLWNGERGAKAILQLEFRPVPDLWQFTCSLPKILEVSRGTLWLSRNDQEPPLEMPVSGRVSFLERKPSRPFWRLLSAGWVWLRNRGIREILEWARKLGFWGSVKFLFCGFIKWLVAVLRGQKGGMFSMMRAALNNAGERRQFRYRLTIGAYNARTTKCSGDAAVVDCVRNDAVAGRQTRAERAWRRLSAPGNVLVGTKDLAYSFKSNPWTQLNDLSVHLEDANGKKLACGNLKVDPIYGVRDHAVQLQFTGQEDQPSALMDLFSFAAYLARVVFKIHLFTFRAPHYPDDTMRLLINDCLKRHVEQDVGKTGERFIRFDPTRMPAVVDRIAPKVCRRVIRPPAPHSEDAYFYLSRYRPDKKPEKPYPPVLMIHGFGASGATFTTSTTRSLASHFLERGHDDVWVIDLPTSIALASSHIEWPFEDAAKAIDQALLEIHRKTGKKVNVVAHCIGSAMFLMSMLARDSKSHEYVNAAVLTQLGPIVGIPELNRLRGYIAGYFKAFMESAMKAEFDIAAARTTMESVIDRALVAYPYEPKEWRIYNPWRPSKVLKKEAYFHRANAIWGKLFEIANLGDETRDAIDDLIGHVNARAMQQTVLFMLTRRICDSKGENAYVTSKRVARKLAFPVCMVHGGKNEVFSSEGAEESFRFIAQARGDRDTVRRLDEAADIHERMRIYEQGKQLRLLIKPKYGHQDLLLGKDAHRDVFRDISLFLEEARPEKADEQCPRLHRPSSVVIARFPRIGPVLGTVQREGGDRYSAMLLVVADDLESVPEQVAAIVYKNGTPCPNASVIVGKQDHRQDLWDGIGITAGYHGTAPDRTWALKIPLPPLDSYSDHIRICVVTLHKEPLDPRLGREFKDKVRIDPTRLALETNFSFPIGDFDCVCEIQEALGKVNASVPTDQAPAIVREWTDALHRALQTRIGYITRFAVTENTADATYQWQAPWCDLEPSVLAAANYPQCEQPDKVSFVLGSCRYAATIFDREMADASFQRLRRRLAFSTGDKPSFLFFAGDQIYSDATAGFFDPTTEAERYDWSYKESWTAPHARSVIRTLPTYMVLDDHEIQEGIENWREVVAAKKIGPRGIALWLLYQRRLAPNGPLYHYDFRSRGFPFFACDTRLERVRDFVKTPSPALRGTIMHPACASRLEDWLKAEQKRMPSGPKFVLFPAVVFPWEIGSKHHILNSLRSDSWDSFPESLEWLLNFICKNGIRNVVFLSGDYHCSVVARATLTSSEASEPVDVYSVVSSALYAPFPFANTDPARLTFSFSGRLADWYDRCPGDLSTGKVNIRYDTLVYTDRSGYALITASARPREHSYNLRIEFDTDKGIVPCSMTLT